MKERNRVRRKQWCIVAGMILGFGGILAGCASEKEETIEIKVFAAKSLHQVVEELAEQFEAAHKGVDVIGNYDSSGTLMIQIEEGAECDCFFSAAQKQMDQLEKEGFLVEGTRYDIVNNEVCVVTYKGSNTKVTGLADLGNAASMALADGSVPVGRYTRQALVQAGLLDFKEDPSEIPASVISELFDGIEVNECANVGAVAAAVSEGANEVGTIYYSDLYGREDRLEILEVVSKELTGSVIYPAAQIKNKEASKKETELTAEWISFLTSEEAKAVFERYYFDTEF